MGDGIPATGREVEGWGAMVDPAGPPEAGKRRARVDGSWGLEWRSDGDGGMVHGSGFGVHGWGLMGAAFVCRRSAVGGRQAAQRTTNGRDARFTGPGGRDASLRILRVLGVAQFLSELQA